MIIGKAHYCLELTPQSDSGTQRYFVGDVWECDCRKRFALLEVLASSRNHEVSHEDWWHYTWTPYTDQTQDEINSNLGRRPISEERNG